MKAIVITKPGESHVLQLQERPTPTPQPGQVLIRVRAAGVNRSDVMLRQGSYGGDSTDQIPGLEVAGTIEGFGPDASRWQIGDRVCALIKDGGYAEFVAVDERHCLPIPENISFVRAASLPETVLTVWSTVFQLAHLQPGEKLLVHGGSSGIGVTVIQLAKAFGSPVYATAGTDEKCGFCEELGAEIGVNYKTDDFEAVLKDTGIDVILDMVGGDYLPKNIRLLNPDGRLTYINSMQGAKAPLHIPTLMQKRLTITGSMLKPRSDDFKAALTTEVLQRVWPLLTDGRLKAIIDRTFPLAEAGQAQDLMESSEHIGKIILDVN